MDDYGAVLGWFGGDGGDLWWDSALVPDLACRKTTISALIPGPNSERISFLWVKVSKYIEVRHSIDHSLIYLALSQPHIPNQVI